MTLAGVRLLVKYSSPNNKLTRLLDLTTVSRRCREQNNLLYNTMWIQSTRSRWEDSDGKGNKGAGPYTVTTADQDVWLSFGWCFKQTNYMKGEKKNRQQGNLHYYWIFDDIMELLSNFRYDQIMVVCIFRTSSYLLDIEVKKL